MQLSSEVHQRGDHGLHRFGIRRILERSVFGESGVRMNERHFAADDRDAESRKDLAQMRERARPAVRTG